MKKIIITNLLVLVLVLCDIFNVSAASRNLVEKDYRVYYIACMDATGNYDINMLIAVNEKSGDIRIVSMLRDLDINGKKLNGYSGTKIEGMRDIINSTYDTNISKYISIRWKDAIKILNEFKPKTVTLTDSEQKYINAYIHNTCEITGIDKLNPAKHYVDSSKQTLTLDGLQLVAYCRLRYGASDWKRTSNQRQIVSELIQELKAKSLLDLTSLFLKYIKTINTDVGLLDFKNLVKDVSKFNIVSTESFPDKELITSVNYHLVPIDIKKCRNNLHKKLFDNDFYDYQLGK